MNSFNAQTTCTESTFNQLNVPSQLIQDDSGVTTSSSIANLEQPSVQSQQIKSLQQNNGIGIQQQGIIPIHIILSQSQQTSKTSQPTIAQGTEEDSPELTATEKIAKLNQQWLDQVS